MAIAWDDSLTVGHTAIDADHRRMMALIQALDAACGDQVDCDRVGTLLAELARVSAEHFAREEQIQDAVGYPERETHRLAHLMLLKRLDAHIGHFEASCPEVRHGMARTLAAPLATWLSTHIAEADMALRPYVGAG